MLAKTSFKLRKLSTSSRLRKYDWPKEKATSFPARYNANDVENGWYDWWEKNNFFKPISHSCDVEKNQRFSIVLPPPNVTGTLHLGHALIVTIQDVLARWYRMKGYDVEWIPGVDHAGIATQVMVEKQLLKKKNVTRRELGRKEFLNEVWNWKNEKGDTIKEQLRTLGASLDWSKECFTMDQNHIKAVNEAILQLWDAGLLFREPALVNWCCFLQSAISDVEVESREISGPTDIRVPGYEKPVQFGLLTDFAFKLLNAEEEVVVSTTRVETIMGDVAVAVHPADPRYVNFHGATLWHPLRHIPIPLICDESVDMNFSTGAVKITPAHDARDLLIAKKHNLPVVQVINEDGHLSDFLHCPVSGLKRFDARPIIVEELKRQGLFRGQRSHNLTLPVCSRSGDIVEYLLKPQWFINCKSMAMKAVKALKDGELEMHPKDFKKQWLTWLQDIRDWNISRQLWWGIQLPLYEVSDINGKTVPIWVVADSVEEAQTKSAEILKVPVSDLSVSQDPDVLDTWFSSALYPFACHGWPQKTDSLDKFFPLDVMITGHDILFYWVARMVMLSTQLTTKLPFKKIFLHGIVCDAEGRKMSKTLGNVISPEDVINGASLKELNAKLSSSVSSGLISAEEHGKALSGQKKLFPKGILNCGADALRFTLSCQDQSRHFINFNVKQCESNRQFCNKIWQAFRFVFGRLEQLQYEVSDDLYNRIPNSKESFMDRWILSRLMSTTEIMNNSLTNIELHNASLAFKCFFYGNFCDVYLESTKPVLNAGLTEDAKQVCHTLLICLDHSLKLMAPFMPYLAEELNMWMPKKDYKPIVMEEFPVMLEEYKDVKLEEEIEFVLGVITSVRSLKGDHGLIHKPTKVLIVSNKLHLLKKYSSLVNAFLNKDEITMSENTDLDTNIDKKTFMLPYTTDTRVYLTFEGYKLTEEYIQLLYKREEKISNQIAKFLRRFNSQGYKAVAEDIKLADKQEYEILQEELVQVRIKLQEAGDLSRKDARG